MTASPINPISALPIHFSFLFLVRSSDSEISLLVLFYSLTPLYL
jgi:hypothetical protein